MPCPYSAPLTFADECTAMVPLEGNTSPTRRGELWCVKLCSILPLNSRKCLSSNLQSIAVIYALNYKLKESVQNTLCSEKCIKKIKYNTRHNIYYVPPNFTNDHQRTWFILTRYDISKFNIRQKIAESRGSPENDWVELKIGFPVAVALRWLWSYVAVRCG